MRRFSSWWAYGIGGAVFLAAAWVSGDAVWLAAHDPVDFAAHRREMLEKLTAERDQAQAALAAVQARLSHLQAERSAQEERRRTADQAIASLRAGDHWWSNAWDKLFGDSIQVRTREERLARLEQTKAEAIARIAELRDTVTRATWERDGVEIDLERVNRRLAAVERDRSKTRHYLSLAWRRSRWYVVAALAAWILAPTVWKLRRRRPEPTGAPPIT
jgi:DNA repair exonuclease SbcCD ATPase subunit